MLGLLRAENPSVVAESIVVIRKMLQQDPEEHEMVIGHLCKQLHKVDVPIARASIVWVVGEYCSRMPLVAPDTLRKMAKSFTSEDDCVKLQVVNMASKLYVIVFSFSTLFALN